MTIFAIAGYEERLYCNRDTLPVLIINHLSSDRLFLCTSERCVMLTIIDAKYNLYTLYGESNNNCTVMY